MFHRRPTRARQGAPARLHPPQSTSAMVWPSTLYRRKFSRLEIFLVSQRHPQDQYHHGEMVSDDSVVRVSSEDLAIFHVFLSFFLLPGGWHCFTPPTRPMVHRVLPWWDVLPLRARCHMAGILCSKWTKPKSLSRLGYQPKLATRTREDGTISCCPRGTWVQAHKGVTTVLRCRPCRRPCLVC